jgi:hypothetical protein
VGNPLKAAEQTDEGPALGAGVAFGRALFPAAGAALHRIVLVEFAHEDAQDVML